jgi:hypothetical protein
MSKSQVSRLAQSLDQIVEDFRTRPLDGAPYPYVTFDALVVKCREGGRTVNVCVVHAVGVNRDGFRESLGLDVVTSEDGAAGGAPARGSRRRPARLHQLPQGALAAAVVEQLARAPEPGDPSPDRRRRHLPRPALDRAPGRRAARRAERRMGGWPPLHESRVGREGAPRAGAGMEGGAGDPGGGLKRPPRERKRARSRTSKPQEAFCGPAGTRRDRYIVRGGAAIDPKEDGNPGRALPARRG